MWDFKGIRIVGWLPGNSCKCIHRSIMGLSFELWALVYFKGQRFFRDNINLLIYIHVYVILKVESFMAQRFLTKSNLFLIYYRDIVMGLGTARAANSEKRLKAGSWERREIWHLSITESASWKVNIVREIKFCARSWARFLSFPTADTRLERHWLMADGQILPETGVWRVGGAITGCSLQSAECRLQERLVWCEV